MEYSTGQEVLLMSELFKERVLIVLALVLCIVVSILGAWDAPEFSPISVVYTEPDSKPVGTETTKSNTQTTTGTTAKKQTSSKAAVTTTAQTAKQSEKSSQTGKININTASQEMLESLPKIGETIAARIIEYRNTYGGFDSIEEIKNVKGIGEKTFEALKDLITVD